MILLVSMIYLKDFPLFYIITEGVASNGEYKGVQNTKSLLCFMKALARINFVCLNFTLPRLLFNSSEILVSLPGRLDSDVETESRKR